MALDDDAIVLPGYGHILVADPGTTPPTNPAAVDITAAVPFTGWTNMGHTPYEDAVSFGKDGDAGDVKKTWQNHAVRKSPDSFTYSLDIKALQMDNDVLTYYFGGGDISQDGSFGVPFSSVPVEKALYVLLIDGTSRAGVGIPKVSLSGDDTPTFDPENFIEFDLKATVLELSGGSDLMRWYRAGLGTHA